MPRRGPTIAQTALALIGERGPLTPEELAPELVALGRTRAKDPVGAVRNAITSWDFLEGRDGRLFALATQLEGAVFTVAPTSLERDEGIVLLRDDLDLVRRSVGGRSWLLRSERHLGIHLDLFGAYFGLPWPTDRFIGLDEDGEWVEDEQWSVLGQMDRARADQLLAFLDELGFEREDDESALLGLVEAMSMGELVHGPAGWLPVLRSREVLGLRIRDGSVRAEAIDRRELKGMHVEAALVRVGAIARSILDPADGPGAPAVAIEDILEVIATEVPDLFRRPLPPIGQLLERAGFEVEDGLVGLPGAAWDDIRWALDPNPESAWGFEPGDAVN